MTLPADLDRLLGPRDVVVVEGPDASKYLQSQISQEIRPLAVGDHRWTFVLDPAGKVVSFARITRTGDERFELDCDAGFGEGLLSRLNRFKIRVNAETSLVTTTEVGPDEDVEHDRIVAGWPRLGSEIVPGETIPGGTGLIPIAVNFTKGCYPGQELVERMDSRAAQAPKTLRHLTVAEGTAIGDPVIDGDQEVGEITSVSGTTALAWVKRSSEIGVLVRFEPAMNDQP
jgi:folate-binding protein YgfZ